MQSKDVQLACLTRNLRAFADSATEQYERVEASARARASAVKPFVRKERKKGRAAVVAWDLGHNPVGRAFVLYKLLEKDYDVDLIGPIWSRYGEDLWSPLKDAGLRVRAFRCENIDDFVPKANMLAPLVTYDVVYVCKPRLPSIYLGTLIRSHSQCPMVLDIDDFELSFFKDETTLTLADIRADAENVLFEPYEEQATRFCHSLISEFDAVTVSNIALRERFGGHMIRHARDESVFAPCAQTRRAAREHLGISDTDYALIFIGTPRPHKGVFEIADALNKLNDPSIVFHIVGHIGDARVRKQFENYPDARIEFHGDCAFEQLPFLLSAADLVPLIQNPDHAISQYQIPAKISDATALGIPVLATDTPPIRDLALQGGIDIVEIDQLADRIKSLRQKGADARRGVRTFFINELGFAINRVRLDAAIGEARERLLQNTPTLNAMNALVEEVYQRRRVHTLRCEERNAIVPEVKALTAIESTSTSDSKARQRPGRKSLTGTVTPLFKHVTNRAMELLPLGTAGGERQYDIAFFWKQNDSGIYGRRSDMVLRYLARSPRVRRIIQFDAPVSAHDIEQNFHAPYAEPNSQSARVLRNIHDRVVRSRDDNNIWYRNFLHSRKTINASVGGSPIQHIDDYPEFVRSQMAEVGMNPERTIAWFCPIVWQAPKLIKELNFASVVSDLIDDQRGWHDAPEMLSKLERSYAETLELSDIVFANCQPLADAFQHYCPPIQVVPNGAERFTEMPSREVPAVLSELPRPIIGYVGNLRDRIDWMLLNEVVRSMPEATFVFGGPAGDSENARQLETYPNVRMLGVIPYAELPAYLTSFDVGIVPHLRNRLTERMNPLKLYNYFAAGLPIVSSDVNNIGELSEFIEVAENPEEFIAALKRTLDGRTEFDRQQRQQVMDAIAWDTRVESILQAMDETLGTLKLRSA